MKSALWGLAVSSIFVLSATHPTTAWAQKGRRVVIEPFAGPSADRFQKMVAGALAKQSGFEMVPDKRVSSVEADLGLIQIADAYPAVAKELKATAFVGGRIDVAKNKKAKGRLVVRDAEGAVAGDESWSAATLAKLMSALEHDVPGKLAELLDRVKGGSGGGGKTAAAKADSAPAAERAPVAAKDDDEFAPKKKNKKADDEAPAAADAPASAETAEATVHGSPSEGAGEGGFAGHGIDLAVGSHVYSRNFTYSDPGLGTQQNYKLPMVPAPNLAVEFYATPAVALIGSFEYSVALFSKDKVGSIYKTKSMAYSVGLKGQHELSGILLNGSLAYGSHNFEVVPDIADTDLTRPQVAGVTYGHVRAGAGARIPTSNSFALIAGLGYLHVLSAGEIMSDAFFPYAKAKGGDGFVGVAIALPWMKGLEGRATLDVRRYVFDMHSTKDDLKPKGNGRVAGGATDQYIGLNLAFAYRSFP